jgi:pimeloyl-ACP methyl ester carboxylesterase
MKWRPGALAAAIAKFNVPTLVIASDGSSELAEQRELARQLPNARMVENAAHGGVGRRPRAIRAAREALSRHGYREGNLTE